MMDDSLLKLRYFFLKLRGLIQGHTLINIKKKLETLLRFVVKNKINTFHFPFSSSKQEKKFIVRNREAG